jgi:hypothetical protein
MTTHVLSHHGDNSAFCTGASRTARTVKESFVLFWWVSVDNKCNVVNVNTACCDICCDKRVCFSAREGSQVTCANILRQVTVQFNARNSSFDESFSQLACAMLGACEDK